MYAFGATPRFFGAPRSVQNAAPAPTDPHLWLNRVPRHDAFVRVFHARPGESKAHREAAALRRALDRCGQVYQVSGCMMRCLPRPCTFP
jgi:hypothetical protein